MIGQQPIVEEEIRREAIGRALAGAKVEAQPQITVLLSNARAEGGGQEVQPAAPAR